MSNIDREAVRVIAKLLLALELRGTEEYRKLRAAPTLSAEAVVSFINQLSPWNLATTGISILEAYVQKQKGQD